MTDLNDINNNLEEIKRLLTELVAKTNAPMSPYVRPGSPHWYEGPIRSYNDAGVGMVICPQCGNKRCPRASNPMYVCTMSNEPNQTPRLRKD